jgi:UDP-3-O-[3-hydroxymyristoyl] glucosamine N-acyltransferase
MPDSRFYDSRGPFHLGDLAGLTGASLVDGSMADRRIDTAAPLGRAGPTGISYLADRKFLPDLAQTAAGACFVSASHAEAGPPGCAVLLSPEPQAAYARAAAHLHHLRSHPPSAPAIHPEAELEAGVVVGHGVVIGPGAKIGGGTEIAAHAVIGPGVAIGRDCRIGANVCIGFALLGDRVRILSGAVIGEAGFGVAASATGAIDAPQLGRVILQDGVTVGALSCIDRGAWDDTVVGENTKIDNLVQIAHNVRIGRNCVLAAQAGIAGSTTIGDGAQFGGKAGTGDHLVLGDRIRMAAGALTMRDIPSGETWCGQPAKPIRKFMREIAWLARKAEARERAGGDE